MLSPGWPCPGCGLLCSDDRSAASGCGLRRAWLARLNDRRLAPPLTDSAASAALATARGWLADAQRILVTGYLSDVATARAAIELAAAWGAAVDHADSQAAFDQLLSWQRRGAIGGTLDEVAWRADAVVLLDATRLMQAYPQLALRLSSHAVGDGDAQAGPGAPPGRHADPSVADPRMADWELLSSAAPPSWRGSRRRLLWIDPVPGGEASRNASGESTAEPVLRPTDWERLGWQVESLTVPISQWHHLWGPPAIALGPQPVSDSQSALGPWTPTPPGAAVARAAESISQLQRSSQYLAVLWPPTITDHPHPGLLLDRLTDWLVAVNRDRRAVALPMAGPSVTFHQVSGWLTGYPGRVQFSEGAAMYQPQSLWGGEWGPGLADLLVWIDAGSGWRGAAPKLPDGWPGRCLTLAPSAPMWLPQHIPAVHFPVGETGWELAGYRFRADAGELVRLVGEVPGGGPPIEGGSAGTPSVEFPGERYRSVAGWIERLQPMAPTAAVRQAADLFPGEGRLGSAEPGRERWD